MVMIINQRKAGMTSATRGYATDNDDGIGKDTTNASGQPRDPAQIKNHDAAQESQSKSAPMEEGVGALSLFKYTAIPLKTAITDIML
jgi:hypothetical protein